jgi:hypothetical protein
MKSILRISPQPRRSKFASFSGGTFCVRHTTGVSPTANKPVCGLTGSDLSDNIPFESCSRAVAKLPAQADAEVFAW